MVLGRVENGGLVVKLKTVVNSLFYFTPVEINPLLSLALTIVS
jgi:hypothetical protein